MCENEQFWTDDYENGSFKSWLRKKYTGPYKSMCHGEGIWQCKRDVKKILERYIHEDVDMPISKMDRMFECGINCVLERLSVEEVFGGNPECFDDIMVDSVVKLQVVIPPICFGVEEYFMKEFVVGGVRN